MAWTWYEGKLQATGRWGEAEKDFTKKVGNHTPFEHLCNALEGVKSGKFTMERSEDGTLWIHGDYWVRFDKEGVIEIGEPAA